MSVVPDAIVGQGRDDGRHVDGAGRVLAQDDAVVRTLAFLAQRLIAIGVGRGDAQGVAHVRSVLRLIRKVRLEALEGRVVGVLQRFLERTATARAALVVVHNDVRAFKLVRRGGVVRVRANSLLDSCGEPDDLEDRAGLHGSIGVIPAVGVVTAEVAAHSARLRVDGHGCGAGILLERGEGGIGGIERRVLDVHVDGRRNLQATGLHVFLGDADGAELGDDLVLDVAVGAGGLRVRGVLRGVARLRELHPGALRGVEDAHLHESIKHVVPAASGGLRVDGRVEGRRRLDDAGEQRGLFRGEVLDVLIEVGVGRRLDTVGVATEIDRVEVRVENGLLVPLVGHLDGVDELASLAHVGPLVAHERVLHVLLGNRRTTTGGGVAGELTHDGATEAGEGKTGVCPELAVLSGQDRVLHVLRNLLELDLRAVALRRDEAGELRLAVVRVDGGNLLIRQFLGFRNLVLRVRESK